MHHSMRIPMPTDISKNENNPWKMMQLPDILKTQNWEWNLNDIFTLKNNLFK